LSLDWGISAVAAATSISLAAFSFTLICMARSFFVTGPLAHLEFIARLVAPLAWGAVSVAAGNAAARVTGGTAHPIVSSCAGLAVFSILYSPVLLLAYRLFGRGLRRQAVTTDA